MVFGQFRADEAGRGLAVFVNNPELLSSRFSTEPGAAYQPAQEGEEGAERAQLLLALPLVKPRSFNVQPIPRHCGYADRCVAGNFATKGVHRRDLAVVDA